MKVLLSWLREFAPIEGDPSRLADELSDLGLAVEGMDACDTGLDGVVVAKVLACRPHPGADRVQLVDVDAGDGEVVQVVCGAFNMQPGDLVPLARPGTTLPGGLRLERRKVRGEWSEGMLCAPDEIGFGTDHSGILILDPGLAPGSSLVEVFDLRGDVLFDLEVNPNRPDAMSVMGVARDLAARLRIPFSIPEPQLDETGPEIGSLASVSIIEPGLCGRFVVRAIEGISTGSSPAWMRRRLSLAGMRPINLVVDVSNYVMLELGQPNHTYDLDLVPDGHLGTRWAHDGERIVTLDGVERRLCSDDGVIVDRDDTAIGIAGVMGGASTEISERTRAVLLEMAWWNPMSIARTSSRLGLRSEASIRFERGADPEILELAAARFCQLLAAHGGEVAKGAVDERGRVPERPPVLVRPARVNGLLGTDLSAEQIRGYLEPIGFRCAPAGPDLEVTIPSFRYDAETETDVIEEIARHHGYGNIGRTVPTSVHIGSLTARQRERRHVRDVLVGLGISEAMPLPFLAPHDLERAGVGGEAVRVTNPLDAQESVLRTSLRPGLLKALAFNESHRVEGAWLFEIGKTFIRPREDRELPDEVEMLSVALAGGDAWDATEVWEILEEALALEGVRLHNQATPGLHPTRSAVLVAGQERLGAVGEIDPAIAAAYEVSERVGWLELDLDRTLSLPHGARRYRPVSRYPSSDIDLAFEVPDEVAAAEIRDSIEEAASPLLWQVELFDVYRGEPVREGARSLAWHLRLQALDRTLTDEEVAEVRQRVITAVEAAHGARLR